MGYNAREVEEAIESTRDFYDWDEVRWVNNGDVALYIDVAGETHVPVTTIDSFGGEGQGDSMWVVVKVGSQFFRKNGYYASHYGTDWDGDFSEVTPQQKTITVWE